LSEGDVDEKNNFTDLGNYGKGDYASPSQIRCTGDFASYCDPIMIRGIDKLQIGRILSLESRDWLTAERIRP